MGGNMARRLTKGGHQCVVFDRNRENVNALAKEGPAPAYSLEELVEKLSAPRALWVMVPSGAPTEETVAALSKPLKSGDAIIDGGTRTPLPHDRDSRTYLAHLRKLETQAKAARRGAWGKSQL
jgi:6-phosphogluconate dehydrogenase (decarboxylating)